jgi:hypothetical protein
MLQKSAPSARAGAASRPRALGKVPVAHLSAPTAAAA